MDFIFLLPLILAPVVFLIVGGVMLGKWRRLRRNTGLMRRVQTIEAARVPGIPAGGLAEVKGTLRCESPLTSEMANRSCAYYRDRVLEVRRQHSGGEHGGSRRVEKTLSDEVRSTPFFVEDATGGVLVNPEGAEVDAEVAVDRFEEADSGIFSNLLGHRYVEGVLPVDAPVYVLGVVGERRSIVAPHPDNGEARFIISHRGEEALEGSWRRQSLWLGLGAGCSLVIGAAALLAVLLTIALLLVG